MRYNGDSVNPSTPSFLQLDTVTGQISSSDGTVIPSAIKRDQQQRTYMAGNLTNVTLAEAGYWSHPVSKGFRHLFYIVTPSESSFESKEHVPDYVNASIPFFLFFVLLEQVILYLTDKPNMRMNDAMSSVTAGTVSLLPLVFIKSIEVSGYIYVHENWCLLQLPWESPWTWFFAFLGVDLGYYWAHRMGHEINFMWAAHQVHHSSEDYNLSTALRQSVLQRYNSWLFYLPMALFVPASAFMVHIQFNLLYQFWIHTEVIRSLGPLEHILNTPSHHRVHHGRNRYCIDKNYAGTLIIWDRIFGTFAWEDEKIAYGLVHPLGSWDAIYVQLCWWKYMITTAISRPGWANKVKTFLHGPGWEPNKPRLGLEEDIPIIDVHVERKNRYNKDVPLWCNIYLLAHFLLGLLAHQLTLEYKNELSQWEVMLLILYVLWTLTNISYVYENKWYAAPLELLRCAVYLLADTYVFAIGNGNGSPLFTAARLGFAISAAIWALQCARSLSGKVDKTD